MAVCAQEEVKTFSQGIVDGNCSLPLSCSCFRLLKPGLDEVNQHYHLDVLPVLLDKASLPVRLKCPFHSSNGQDVYCISVVTDKGSTDPQCPSQLAFLSFSEVPYPSNSQMCLDARLNCQNCTDLPLESADAYSPCGVDIDIEKKNLETSETDDKNVGTVKTEGALTRVFRRMISLLLCGKYLQLLLNQSPILLKFTSGDKSTTERANGTPSNKWRRYKRTSSFNSRKIALLFSLLSSMGTMLLIYLTLRVRPIGDGFVNV